MKKFLFVTLCTLLYPLVTVAAPLWDYQPQRLNKRIGHHNTVTHYSIQPTSLHDLPAALDRATPITVNAKVFHGYTRWSVDWYFWYKKFNGQCYIERTEVKVNSALTMPQLRPEAVYSEQIKNVFNQYYDALLTHEHGHVMMAIHAANGIEASLMATPAQLNCKTTGEVANQRANSVLTEFIAQEKHYDKLTEHGKTQGARVSVYLPGH